MTTTTPQRLSGAEPSAADALRIPPEIVPNSLYYGDCLGVMANWSAEQADLIYLDPPFNSNQDYNVLYGHDEGKLGRTAQRQAFTDTWSWDTAAQERVDALKSLGMANPLRDLTEALEMLLGEGGMLAYVTYMAERLYECHRVLKPTGSIYVHCDDTAVHYIKAVLDAIFGPQHYRNDVVWRRATAHNDSSRYGRICDHILYFTKSDSYTWNGDKVLTPWSDKEIEKAYPSDDHDGRGRYRAGDLTGAGRRGGESGDAWHGYDVDSRSRHWGAPIKSDYAAWIDEKIIPGYLSIAGTHDRLDALDNAGMIHHPGDRGVWPGLKRYAAGSPEGVRPQSLILSPGGFTNYNKGSEWVGYDTQKPLALLDKLIRASSNKDDLVLDPFGGCGTTAVAAHQSGRRWAAIDISVEALEVTKRQRLSKSGVVETTIFGIPADVESARLLAATDPLAFERWAVQAIPGMLPNDTQVGDKGIDGMGEVYGGKKVIGGDERAKKPLVLVQVSASERPSLGKVRDFCRVLNRDGAALGIFITVDRKPTSSARSEAREMGKVTAGGTTTEYPRLQFWSIRDYYDRKMPNLPPLKNPHTGKPVELSLF